MPAYLRELLLGKCLCGKPITHEAFNKFNASLGRWCKACAQERVDAQNGQDRSTSAPAAHAAEPAAARGRRPARRR